jgi:hypothetical protein
MLQHVDTMIGFCTVMLLLSLLITVLVQAVVAALNLRGANLFWGVTRILQQVGRFEKEGTAKALAAQVLKHPSLSSDPMFLAGWDRFHYTDAIRVDELERVLRDLAKEAADKKAAADQKAADKKAAADEKPSDKEAAADKKAAADQKAVADENAVAFEAVIKGIEAGRATAWKDPSLDELKELFPEQAPRANIFLTALKKQLVTSKDGLKDWYDTVMDRTSERFVRHTRVATVVFAVLVGFGLQVDALDVFHRISADPELRARLVQSADATLKLADDYRAKSEPKPADTAAPSTAAAEKLTELSETAKAIKQQLEKDDVSLTPKPSSSAATDYWSVYRSGRRLAGMFITVLLLSLGAPFWYNLLRQLANLRPLLAGKVDKTEAAD